MSLKKLAKILLYKLQPKILGSGVHVERTFDCRNRSELSRVVSSASARPRDAQHQLAFYARTGCPPECHGCSLSAHRLMPPMCAFD